VQPESVLSRLAIQRGPIFSIEGREIIGRVLWVLEGPEKGFEEHFSSSGLGKRRSWWKRTCPEWHVCVRVVSEPGIDSLFSIAEKENSPCRPEEKDNHPTRKTGR
jgi:hypothetical protein